MWDARIDVLVPTWCHIGWTNNVPIVAAKANIAEICGIFPLNAEYFVYDRGKKEKHRDKDRISLLLHKYMSLCYHIYDCEMENEITSIQFRTAQLKIETSYQKLNCHFFEVACRISLIEHSAMPRTNALSVLSESFPPLFSVVVRKTGILQTSRWLNAVKSVHSYHWNDGWKQREMTKGKQQFNQFNIYNIMSWSLH